MSGRPDNVVPLHKPVAAHPPRIFGIARMGEGSRTVTVIFSRPLTDAEMSEFHDAIRAAWKTGEGYGLPLPAVPEGE